jgi:hypothetical protein
MLRFAAQPLHRLHQRARIPHRDGVGADARLDQLAAQPRRHRIDVPLHRDRGPSAHPHGPTFQRLQRLPRQRTQAGLLCRELHAAACITPGHHAADELPVQLAAGKVATAAQHQLLRQRLLETPVGLLAIAVLMAAVGVRGLGRQPIVTQQRLVARRVLLRVAVVMHRQRHAIRAMPLRHAAQFPQRILQALAQAGKTLRKAQRHALPVRARQHKVINQMREGLTLDGHPQALHVREVGRPQPARRMLLGKEQLLGRPVLGFPLPHAPFDGATLPLPVLPGLFALQPVHQGLGLQSRLALQQLLQPRPDLGERIDPRPPVMHRPPGAGQFLAIPVFSSTLAIHACFHRCPPQRRSLSKMATKLLDLRIGHLPSASHWQLRLLEELPGYRAAARSVRTYRWGRIIVAGGEGYCTFPRNLILMPPVSRGGAGDWTIVA